MRFFPYEPRRGQRELARLVAETIAERGHLAVEAGTGSGKTVTVLAAALEAAAERGLRVLYATRTNAQQRQALVEFRAIRARMGLEPAPLALGVQGRAHFCPKMRADERFAGATPEELSKLCSDAKKRTVDLRDRGARAADEPRACAWYAGLLGTEDAALQGFARGLAPLPDEFASGLEERGVCPYEAVKVLLPGAVLAAAPYAYVFDARLRRNLLDRLGAAAEQCILVVDEAHNLPEWAREALSARLTAETLARARAEAAERDNPDLGGMRALDLLEAMERAMRAVGSAYLAEDDGLVPPSEFEAELMSALRCTSHALLRAAEGLVGVGLAVQDARRKRGELPRSYAHAVGAFLAAWMNAPAAEYARLVLAGPREKPALELAALDPGLATRACLEFHASVHMSGTLRPLDQYRDAVGLPPRARLAAFPGPFPPEHLTLLYAQDVTTKFEALRRDAAMATRLHEHVVAVANATRRNTAVFYPSYAMLRAALDAGLRHDLRRRVLVDDRELSRAELAALLDAFRRASREEGAVLLSVMGGRLSEGVDFPAEQLEVALLVGLPYARPSARQRALQAHMEARFGRGWEYASEAPMLRKLLQSMGRLLRTPEDRALAVILDARAARLRDRLPPLEAVEGPVLEERVRAWDANIGRKGTIGLSQPAG